MRFLSATELARRLESVLQSLYLLFNEGYKASGGDKLVREELCHEAIRLTELLAQHRAGNQPKTHALLALMLLNAARTPAREDDQGNLLRLEEQDRTRWDQTMIARGMSRLRESAAGRPDQRISSSSGDRRVSCDCSRLSIDRLGEDSLALRSINGI